MSKNDFPDPHKKIDEVLRERKKEDGMLLKSTEIQRVHDNLEFRNEVKDNPIKNEHEKKIFGVETITLTPYLNMRLWPRSIYVTDKLIRLVASARLDFLKRYLAKKRRMSFNFYWLMILIIGVVIALLAIIFLLPTLGAAL